MALLVVSNTSFLIKIFSHIFNLIFFIYKIITSLTFFWLLLIENMNV